MLQNGKTSFSAADCLKKPWTVFLLALVLHVGPSSGVKPEEECGGPLSHTPFTCILDGMEYSNRCSYPTHKLNVDCMLFGCPRLNGLNPLNRDKSVNQTALKAIIAATNDCIAHKSIICDMNMTSLPTVQVGCTLDQLLPAFLSVNGSCYSKPNTGALQNFNRAVFSLPPQQNSTGPVITLSFAAPNITKHARWNCSMSIPTVLTRPAQEIRVENVDFTDIEVTITIAVSATVSIDLSAKQPAFTLIDNNSSVSIRVSNFVSCTLRLPWVLVELISLSLGKLLGESVTTFYAENFLSTFATQSIFAAKKSCQHD